MSHEDGDISSLLDELDVVVEAVGGEEEEEDGGETADTLRSIQLTLVKEATDEEFGFTISEDSSMKLEEVREGTPAFRAGLTSWIGSRLSVINEQEANQFLVATALRVNVSLSLVFTFAPPLPPAPPPLSHTINILGTSDELLLTGSKGSTDTHSKDASETEKKYLVAEHPNQVPIEGDETGSQNPSSGNQNQESNGNPPTTSEDQGNTAPQDASENVLRPPAPAVSAPPVKKKLRIQANWDRVFAASIQQVAEKRQTEVEREEALENASQLKRIYLFAMNNLTIKNMTSPAYEVSIITLITILLTAAMSTPACVGLASGDWHSKLSSVDVVAFRDPSIELIRGNETAIEYQFDLSVYENRTFIEIVEYSRTRWCASEWVVLGLMQYAITFCLVPWDAWRWVSTTKLISTAAIVMWLFTEKVSGFIHDEFYIPAILIHVGVAFGDFFYLVAIKRARPWINIAAVLFPAAYGFIIFHYLLRPYENASSGEQIGLRVFLFPPTALLINTTLTWISRHWSVTDIHHLKIGLSLSSIAISASIGRVMIVHAEPDAQGVIITLTAIITLFDRVTYLQRSAAIDYYTQVLIFKRTKAEAFDFINSTSFREVVSTEYLFILICELSAIVAVGILHAAGWESGRYFFDLYTPNKNFNGLVGGLTILQLVIEVAIAIVCAPLQQITYCMSLFRLPLFHTAVRFTDRPRLVIIGTFSILFIIHLMLSCQKTYLKWIACSEHHFYDDMVCQQGGIIYPNDNKTFCCDWDGTHLENINIYYP